ncbi:MAG: hypothetical protein IPI49_23000, partial [Myxococcales bacterium]|nr:hypothetical protein [Myxococcales bacterium]
MRRRVWCETLPFEELCAPGVLHLLARFHLELLLAVRPWQLAEIPGVVARLRDAGVVVALWPMLEDAHGRWASARSLPAFVPMVDDLLARVPGDTELVIDLEPAISDLLRWKAWRPGQWTGWRGAASSAPAAAAPQVDYRAASAALARAVERWRGGDSSDGVADGPRTADLSREALASRPAPGARAGATHATHATPAARRVSTAVMPIVPFDSSQQWMQRALGTPADELPVQHHSVMAYTSLLEGWSRGLIGRRRAEWLLGVCARRTRARWGSRGGVSLGAVGTGAFGDEPVYRSPAELARDVD